jgi:hypothetical protein
VTWSALRVPVSNGPSERGRLPRSERRAQQKQQAKCEALQTRTEKACGDGSVSPRSSGASQHRVAAYIELPLPLCNSLRSIRRRGQSNAIITAIRARERAVAGTCRPVTARCSSRNNSMTPSGLREFFTSSSDPINVRASQSQHVDNPWKARVITLACWCVT